jgi:hypothetical protein
MNEPQSSNDELIQERLDECGVRAADEVVEMDAYKLEQVAGSHGWAVESN